VVVETRFICRQKSKEILAIPFSNSIKLNNMTQQELDQYFETCIARWRQNVATLPESYNTLEKLEEKLKEPETLFYLQNCDKKCEEIIICNSFGDLDISIKNIKITKKIESYHYPYFYINISFLKVSFKNVRLYSEKLEKSYENESYTQINWANCSGNLKLIGDILIVKKCIFRMTPTS
jgi:hypothetical protein